MRNLISSCEHGYRVIQIAATQSDLRREDGYVALNLKRVLNEAGVAGDSAHRIRYYLKELSLIRMSVQVLGKGRRHQWWWYVSNDQFVPERLVEIANSDKAYRRIEVDPRNNFEDTDSESLYAGNTPPVLPDELCGPVVIRHRDGNPDRSSGEE
jgi:hypothetical protein